MRLLNITLPVFNEESALASSIARLHAVASSRLPFRWNIVIADNGSTDRTPEIARSLAEQYANTSVVHLDQKGRGRALKAAWLESGADILSYMDADLSTDLEALPALLRPLDCGLCDVAIGSRLLRAELTTRSLRREFISRSYNFLLKAMLGVHFSDAQCGFKAITSRAAEELLPLVADTAWFFDTELLVLAERLGYRIFELPVRWTEERNSHVKILRTALQDIQGVLRLRRRFKNTAAFRRRVNLNTAPRSDTADTQKAD